MTRRHWCWPATLAVLCGLVVSGVYWAVLFAWQHPFLNVAEAISRFLGGTGGEHGWQTAVSYSLVITLPGLLVTVLVTTFMVRRRVMRQQGDGETRCRKCDYILRGLTDPRCPECGERI